MNTIFSWFESGWKHPLSLTTMHKKCSTTLQFDSSDINFNRFVFWNIISPCFWKWFQAMMAPSNYCGCQVAGWKTRWFQTASWQWAPHPRNKYIWLSLVKSGACSSHASAHWSFWTSSIESEGQFCQGKDVCISCGTHSQWLNVPGMGNQL